VSWLLIYAPKKFYDIGPNIKVRKNLSALYFVSISPQMLPFLTTEKNIFLLSVNTLTGPEEPETIFEANFKMKLKTYDTYVLINSQASLRS